MKPTTARAVTSAVRSTPPIIIVERLDVETTAELFGVLTVVERLLVLISVLCIAHMYHGVLFMSSLTSCMLSCIDKQDDMKGFITVIARLIQAGQRMHARKWSFLGMFAFVFLGSVFVLGKFDLLP